MESNDLNSASKYINNLLLARGLLHHGKTIDFAQLALSSSTRKRKHHERQLRFEDGQEPEKEIDKDVDVRKITAQVLNLVHDLVIRRDHEISQQEHTAQTIHDLRNEANNALATTRKMEATNADLKRQLATKEATMRAAESAARAAETSARLLRDEVTKIKALFTQVRIQCVNDIRKRDLELSRLKAHLSGQQRGATGRVGVIAPALVVASSCKITRGSNASSLRSMAEVEQTVSVHDAEYSLRQETNEFLTQLSQSLSDENDSLITLLRGTLSSVRELQGIQEVQQTSQAAIHEVSGHSSTSSTNDDALVTVLETSYATLASELEPVLASLRDLLSTPSFVSIEEVQVRDDEIRRLRDGWNKMETRWREAVMLMQGWRRRMLSGGDTVNLDEVRQGLKLGEGADEYLESSGNDEECIAADQSGVAEESYVGGADESLVGEEDSVLEHSEMSVPILLPPSAVGPLHYEKRDSSLATSHSEGADLAAEPCVDNSPPATQPSPTSLLPLSQRSGNRIPSSAPRPLIKRIVSHVDPQEDDADCSMLSEQQWQDYVEKQRDERIEEVSRLDQENTVSSKSKAKRRSGTSERVVEESLSKMCLGEGSEDELGI